MKRALLVLGLLIFSLIFPNPTGAYEKASASSAFLRKPEVGEDRRVRILSLFLQSYRSPLAPSSEIFVREADKNELDWRLLPAIAGVESTFGKEIPNNSYNAWGWGIYGTNVIYFASFDEGIQTISNNLRSTYIDRWGAKTVFEIGRFYAASPTWAKRVVWFMNKIEQFEIRNPDVALSLTI